MGTKVYEKTILSRLINGTLETTLCRICLKPFGEVCENIFTQFWFVKRVISVAEIIKILCQFEFPETENYYICSDCITEAFAAYNLYLKFQNSTKLLEAYVEEINECTTSAMKICTDLEVDKKVCLQVHSAEELIDRNALQNYDIQHFLSKSFEMCPEELDIGIKKKKSPVSCKISNRECSDDYVMTATAETTGIKIEWIEDENEEKGVRNTHNRTKIKKNNSKTFLDEITGEIIDQKTKTRNNKRRNGNLVKRMITNDKTAIAETQEPEDSKICKICSSEYTSFSRLLNHIKLNHNVNYCKVCTDYYNSTDEDLEAHMKLHEGAYCCDICKMIVKDKTSMVKHLSTHNAYLCYKCGADAPSARALSSHLNKHSDQIYSCKYCGKCFQRLTRFKLHIAKHELAIKNNLRNGKQINKVLEKSIKKPPRAICSICGLDFVDNRALKMHVMRIHTGETPYSCEECGQRFVEKYLKTQHVRSHHQVPEYRCPLCTNAFHTVGYVNSHIRKVHLRKDKRYNRGFVQHVTWPTKVVPFHDLSIANQHSILDMVRAGELTLPEEIMTENLRKLLEAKIDMDIL